MRIIESLFLWQHPLIELNSIRMCLFNIRSWNSHLEHFLSDKVYSTYSTYTQLIVLQNIDDILDDWGDIHKNTQHGLDICYNVSKVNIIEVIEIPSVLEVLPVILEIEKETFIGDGVPYAWSSCFFHG